MHQTKTKHFIAKLFAPVQNVKKRTVTALFTFVYTMLIATPQNLAGFWHSIILMRFRSFGLIQSTTILVQLLPIFPRYRPKFVHTLRYYCLATTRSQSQAIVAKLYNFTARLHENIATCKAGLKVLLLFINLNY